MSKFLVKYHPSIKKQLHENRIAKLRELLEREIEAYRKAYDSVSNTKQEITFHWGNTSLTMEDLDADNDVEVHIDKRHETLSDTMSTYLNADDLRAMKQHIDALLSRIKTP